MRNHRQAEAANRIFRNRQPHRPVDTTGTYRGARELPRNDPCPCAKMALPEADTLPAHKVKKHDALYAHIAQRIFAEQRAKSRKAALDNLAARVKFDEVDGKVVASSTWRGVPVTLPPYEGALTDDLRLALGTELNRIMAGNNKRGYALDSEGKRIDPVEDVRVIEAPAATPQGATA